MRFVYRFDRLIRCFRLLRACTPDRYVSDTARGNHNPPHFPILSASSGGTDININVVGLTLSGIEPETLPICRRTQPLGQQNGHIDAVECTQMPRHSEAI